MAKSDNDDDHAPSAAEVKRGAQAAEVVSAVGRDAARLSGHGDKLLALIHSAPQDNWAALVQEVLDYSLDLSQLKQRVAELKAEPTEVAG